ncbi:MAG TPA: LacI family DNA-binding transcriptional regulator [Candidatus Dormibacteraeota bacterium]|nr:LacI family DNA-binding transcriptional regulator [Candidatus Dormibacteraeota bacterium]
MARAAGVSTGAVSYALNGRPGVTEETRRRILAAARQLGWRPSASAKALVHARTYAVGLVMARPPELLASDPFFPRFLAAVEATLSERDHALLLQVVGDDESRELECYERLASSHRVDGVFLTDLRLDDPRFALVERLDLPAVGVGQPLAEVTFPWIASDDASGMAQVVHHLVALGHERIAYVGGPPCYVHSAHRERAWREALERAGIAPGPTAAGDFSGPGGAVATAEVLAHEPPPSAIVYANDLMAIAGMGVAARLGLRVPEDLSMVGFDDIPAAAHVSPGLTTVRADVATWGRLAATLLLAEVEGQAIEVPSLEPPRLVIRGSTGPPPRAGAGTR